MYGEVIKKAERKKNKKSLCIAVVLNHAKALVRNRSEFEVVQCNIDRR